MMIRFIYQKIMRKMLILIPTLDLAESLGLLLQANVVFETGSEDMILD